MTFDVTSDASAEELDRSIATTERYCVVLQTLAHTPQLSASRV